MDHIPHIPGATPSESSSRIPSVSFASCDAGGSPLDPPGDSNHTGEPPVPSLHALEPPPPKPPPGSLTSDLPDGSLIDHILRNNACPSSPTCPFEFPINVTPLTGTTAPDPDLRPSALRLAELPDFPLVMDSITHVVGSPRMFGLRTDCSSYAQVKRTSATLIDGGANICLTGDLNLLVKSMSLKFRLYQSWWQSTGRNRTLTTPSLGGVTFRSTYRMGVHIGNSASIAKMWLRQSSPHRQFWRQVTYLPQTGFKDGRPGRLRFDSHDGLCTMQLNLDYHDGLYYCPTDVFTVDQSPVCHPATHRTVSQPHPSTTRCPYQFPPTSKSKQV